MAKGPEAKTARERGDEMPPAEVERRAMAAARRLLTTPKGESRKASPENVRPNQRPERNKANSNRPAQKTRQGC